MRRAEIIERLEKAEGADRELDAHIYAMLNGGRVHFINADEKYIIWEKPVDGFWIRRPLNFNRLPKLTASLDAAIALVKRALPGCYREMSGPRKYLNIPTPVPARFRSELMHDAGSSVGWHDCEPIALLISLFRALEAKEAGNG